MNNNGCIIPEIDEQNIGVQQENATFLVIGDEAYTSEIIEEYNRNAAAKTEEFNTNATNKTNDFNTNYDNKLEAFNSNAVAKTEDFDSHVTAQTTNFNNNAETATVNFNKNAAQKTDEFNKNAMSYSQSIEENKKNIASTSNELYHLKTDILETGESSGNNIHLEDSAWAEMQEIKVDGVCEQNTTTGKNLLDYISNLLTPSNGLTSTLNEDGSITTTGKPIANYSAITKSINITDILEDEQTYTISRESTNNKIYIQIMAKKATDGTLTYINNIFGSNSFKVDKTTYVNYNMVIQTNTINIWGDAPLTITNKYMLYKGTDTTDTSFEPYTGGQPSPSPDYPQKIKTITDSLKITSCGRNLLKNIATSATINGISFTVNDDGSVLANGTATADAILKIVPIATTFSQNLILSPNKTYTLSDSVGNYTDYFTQVVIQDANGNKNWYNTAGDIDISANVITCLYTAQIYVRKDKTVNNVLFKPQLVVKDSANLFEPYVESQIQVNLPENEFIGKLSDTYKDTLRAEYNKDDGQYHLMLDKMIGKYTFTGNENWATYTQSNGIPIFRCTLPASGYFVKSNYFVSQTAWSTLLEENRIFNHVGNYQNIEIACSKFDTLTNFKNFLTTNVVQMYHGLKTPYTIDLGVIDMPLTYDEITNIFTDSDLLPTINVKYYRNFIATIQNLQVNNDTLKNELSNIESRLTALESANTNVESRLTTLENANKNVADSNPTEESEVTE